MDVLRVVAECYLPNMYFDPGDNGTTTIWHGSSMWFLKDIAPHLPPMEIVSDMSPSNVTLMPIQTLADGRADLANDNYGLTASRWVKHVWITTCRVQSNLQ